MSRWSSTPAILALAAGLWLPVIIAAQNSLDMPAAPTTAGAAVYNAQNEMIGVLSRIDGRDSDLVLSLGGFRGIAGKVVEIPRGSVHAIDDKLIIGGATKNQLMQLPPFKS